MITTQVQQARYERKFVVETLDARQVCGLVWRHPALFRSPYPARYINNLYLDSEEMEHYNANLSGQSERQKVRIRWYGSMFGQIDAPLLEFKVKHGLVGNKYSYPLPAFRLEPGFNQRDFQNVLQAADLPPLLKLDLARLKIVLCNRYYRWYFATPDGNFRTTVDAQICYYPVRRQNNRFRPRRCEYRQVILELKYAQQLERSADRIAGFFPLRIDRNSKYITGIERIYG